MHRLQKMQQCTGRSRLDRLKQSEMNCSSERQVNTSTSQKTCCINKDNIDSSDVRQLYESLNPYTSS